MEDFGTELMTSEFKIAAPGSQFLRRTMLLGAIGYSPLLPMEVADAAAVPMISELNFCDSDEWTAEDEANEAHADTIDEDSGWTAPSIFDRLPGLEMLCASNAHERDQAESHLADLLGTLKIPPTWLKEGVEEPTKDCMDYARIVLSRLSEKYGLMPYKVACSREGGVFAAYRNPDNANILRLEIDNELDAVAVVSDGNRILESGILEDDDLEDSIIHAFRPPAAVAVIV